MKQFINSEENMDTDSMPRATLIVPYEQEMNNPKLLRDILESAVQKKEKVLTLKYSKEIVISLMRKLRDSLMKVKSIPNDKTLTIFVSPVLEKSYYTSLQKKIVYAFCACTQRRNRRSKLSIRCSTISRIGTGGATQGCFITKHT